MGDDLVRRKIDAIRKHAFYPAPSGCRYLGQNGRGSRYPDQGVRYPPGAHGGIPRGSASRAPERLWNRRAFVP